MRDTRPLKCPLLGGKKCMGESCAFWQDMIMQEGDKMEVVWACVAVWSMRLGYEQAKEMRQTAASSDKVASEVQAGAATILLRAMAMQQPQLENQDASDDSGTGTSDGRRRLPAG